MLICPPGFTSCGAAPVRLIRSVVSFLERSCVERVLGVPGVLELSAGAFVHSFDIPDRSSRVAVRESGEF